jgi:uncharacterized protein (TIGR02679 family)
VSDQPDPDQREDPARAARLRRALGGPETAWLLERVRRRIAGGKELTGTISLARPTPAQRRAVESLLGRSPRPGDSVGVPLAALDEVIRHSGLHPDGLAAAVRELIGPVADETAERAAVAAAWNAALRPLVMTGPAAAWGAAPATTTLVRRLTGNPVAAVRLVGDLVAVLAALPADGVPLARLAARATGDAHALDRGRPLATLVLSAIRVGWWRGDDEPDGTPAQRRRLLWDTVGVLVDELSSTVLALNVPFAAGSPLGGVTAAARRLGEPVVLTLRQVARAPVGWVAPTVFVCENPAVVAAAADHLGPGCPPLICVGGQPSTAALHVLDAAAAAGAMIWYHGDFDWGGLRIGNLLHQRLRWRPWRFDTSAYVEAVAQPGAREVPVGPAPAADRQPGSLAGTPVAARWDPHLAGAMIDAGRRVEEELLLEDLLADLAAPLRR